MAVVNFKASSDTLTKVLNNQYNVAGQTYRLYVLNSDKQTISGAFITCAFNDATMSGGYAFVDFEQARYVVIPSGTTIGYIAIQEESPGSKVYITEEPIDQVYYNLDGTYTVSNLTIKIGG